MTDVTSWLAMIVGGGGALSIIAAGILWVTKEAIAKAVTQAGAREMERLKAELAKELEKERQAFTRDLERERFASARALEEFKSELTLAAEVRRQAAAKKVAALTKVADITFDLLGRALYERDIEARITAFNEYMTAVRQAEPVVPVEMVRRMGEFGVFLQENAGTLDRILRGEVSEDTMAFSRRAEAARSALVAAIRSELQIDVTRPTPRKPDSAPAPEASSVRTRVASETTAEMARSDDEEEETRQADHALKRGGG